MNSKHRPLSIVIVILSMQMLAACDRNVASNRLVGQLESERIEITAEFSEPITSRPIAEGEPVAEGQIVIQQDTSRAAAKVAEAQASLQQIKARLDELVRGPRRELILAAQARSRGAQKELEFRQADLARAEEVFARNLASPDVRDRAIVARDTALANLESDAAKLDELLKGTTTEELRQVEQAVAQAAARLDTAHINLARHSAVAHENGIVDSLLFEVGERPMPGQPMAILLSGKQAYARVYIPEALRVHVIPGTQARLFVDGLEETLTGRVRWVASEAAFTPYFALTERDRGRLTFAAKIDIVDASERLPDGVPVQVELVLANNGG